MGNISGWFVFGVVVSAVFGWGATRKLSGGYYLLLVGLFASAAVASFVLPVNGISTLLPPTLSGFVLGALFHLNVLFRRVDRAAPNQRQVRNRWAIAASIAVVAAVGFGYWIGYPALHVLLLAPVLLTIVVAGFLLAGDAQEQHGLAPLLLPLTPLLLPALITPSGWLTIAMDLERTYHQWMVILGLVGVASVFMFLAALATVRLRGSKQEWSQLLAWMIIVPAVMYLFGSFEQRLGLDEFPLAYLLVPVAWLMLRSLRVRTSAIIAVVAFLFAAAVEPRVETSNGVNQVLLALQSLAAPLAMGAAVSALWQLACRRIDEQQNTAHHQNNGEGSA